MQKQGRTKWILAVIFLLAASTVFIVRGPIRALDGGSDLAVLYGATRAWMAGNNPYSLEYVQAGYEHGGGGNKSFNAPSLNPPVIFPLLSPICALPWTWARGVWLVLNLGFLAYSLTTLIRLMGWRGYSLPTLCFVSGALALAPLHSGLWLGQVALAATTCLIAAMQSDLKRRPIRTGVFLALAAAIKPQIGALFILFYLLRGRWKIVTAAAITGIALCIVGVGWLEIHDVAWLQSLRQGIDLFSHGGLGDPTAANPLRFHLINLHYPLHTFLDSRLLVNLMVVGFVSILGIVGWRLDRSAQSLQIKTAVYTLLAIASLIGTYHRAYDAVLLILPFALFMKYWCTPEFSRSIVIIGLVSLMAFLSPGGSLLMYAADHESVSESLVESSVWQSIIAPHQAWALLVIGGVLITATMRLLR